MSSRVVITGMGAVTPVGLDIESNWASLVAGKSGVDFIRSFDSSPFDTKIAGEVKGFDPLQYVDRKDARRMDRFVHLAIAAALQAVEQSKLKIDAGNADDIGCYIGSGIGGIATLTSQIPVLLDKGPSRLSPFLCTMMIPDIAAGQIAIALGIRGPNFCVVSACASGASSIGEAFETIRRGDAICMLAGASEAAVTPIGIGAFNVMRAISTANDEPQKASRPFDLKRDGFVPAEGAAVVVLENLDYARARGADILAEVIGYGASADASHVTAPSDGGAGATLAMRRAIRKAEIDVSEIDYVNAHGTSTQLNDKNETMALKTVLGDRAYKVPVSATKSMTGHMMGAGGAFEVVVSVKTILTSTIHPTINLDHPDPDCDLNYVPHKPLSASVRTILSNSFGFGGHNACLVIRAYEE